MKENITQAELKRRLHYNPKTGIFTWLISNNRSVKIGAVAGYFNCSYNSVGIKIDGKLFAAHRLAWLYMKGYFPEHEVDHKSGIRSDNRWVNLRHVTHSCNMQNQKINDRNTSGFPGVSWNKSAKKWSSRIKINEKEIYLGLYDDALNAALARFTFEIWCPLWKCNYRSQLAKAIKVAWPEFKSNND